jgi:hypothetical protein
MPCTSLGHSSPPPRAQPHQLRRPSLRSGELLLLLPPLWLFSEQFTRLSSFATSPQTQNTAPLPSITNRTSPAMTPAAELHHPTVVSPLSVTSGKIGPTLKLASLFSCYGTCLFPRNRGGELPLNPPAAGFSPRDGRFTPFPVCADAVSPPALPGVWACNHDVVSRPWAVLGQLSRARVRARTRLGRNSPPSPPEPKILFLFLFFFPFSYVHIS